MEKNINGITVFDIDYIAVINLFCGTGKTWLIFDYLYAVSPHKTMICFSSIDLIVQFIDEYNKTNIKSNVKIIRYDEINSEAIYTEPFILLTTYQSSNKFRL